MGAKAKGKAKGKARTTDDGPKAKRSRTEGPPPVFSTELARPKFGHEPLSETLKFLVLDVVEGASAESSDLWLHGVTARGQSVAANIVGFYPYFYCQAPAQVNVNDFAQALAARLAGSKMAASDGTAVRSVVRLRRRPLMFYQPEESDMFRVEVALHRLLSPVSKEVERGFLVKLEGDAPPLEYRSATWESDVPFVLRFMVDSGLVGAGWLELPVGHFSVEETGRKSTAQLEVKASPEAVRTHAPEGDFLALAPIRLLSIDAREDGSGSVVTIAAVLWMHGESSVMSRLAWVRAPSTLMEGLEIFSFDDERDLLEHFRAFLAHCDADGVVGYDLLDRVVPLLLGRAKVLRTNDMTTQLGRLAGVESKVTRGNAQTPRNQVNVEGRLMLDVSRLVSSEHKLVCYALPAVVQHFLERTHFELRAADVDALLGSKPCELAWHTLKDAEASKQLLEKLCFGYNLFEMARVTGVPVDYLLTRGQMIKVTSQLLRKARADGFVLPGRGPAGADSFEGGWVMEPKVGLYEEPVVTLDFASLYPSIMIANNLCYTTLLPEGGQRALGLEAESVVDSPASGESGNAHKFVTTKLRRGILPAILEELLSARKAAKRDMKLATDPMMRAVLNGRQLALKISANSVYGFTGATSGNLPCIEIAASVTAYGREMIISTEKFIEGSGLGARVIYGDTDSVMISFGAVSRQEAVSRGCEAARLATERFVSPIRLEYEKVYQPYLLLNKKRYAGLPWDGDVPLSLDTKGIETVRRDFCGLVRQVCERSLELLLRPDRSLEAATQHVRDVVADLRRGTIDPSLLIISKTMAKKGEADYVAKTAHVELAEKLKKRDPKSAPRPGDRVPYIVIAGAAGAKVYERAEDPQYAETQGLPIDADYYIEQQLRQPLLRIFEPVVGGDPAKVVSMLFAGGEGRRTSAPSAVAKSGLGAFMKKSEKCMVCGAVVPHTAAFCKNCAGTEKAEAAREAKIVERGSVSARKDALRARCSGCVGSALGDAHERCANVSCEIFFERARVCKALDQVQASFTRLNLDW